MKQIILCNKFRSTRKSIEDLDNILHSLEERISISASVYRNIYLCIYELFLNAIYHGNHINSSKYVELIIEKQNNKLIITVVDNGDGFSFENLPDPTANENLLKESGRGIFIVKNYANTIEYKHTTRGFCAIISFESVL